MMESKKERKPQKINIDSRWAKALEECTIVAPETEQGVYFVFSETSKKFYRVLLKGKDVRECQCSYGQIHRSACCKHVLAAARYAAVERGYKAVRPVANDFDWRTVDGACGTFALAEGFALMVCRK